MEYTNIDPCNTTVLYSFYTMHACVCVCVDTLFQWLLLFTNSNYKLLTTNANNLSSIRSLFCVLIFFLM